MTSLMSFGFVLESPQAHANCIIKLSLGIDEDFNKEGASKEPAREGTCRAKYKPHPTTVIAIGYTGTQASLGSVTSSLSSLIAVKWVSQNLQK